MSHAGQYSVRDYPKIMSDQEEVDNKTENSVEENCVPEQDAEEKEPVKEKSESHL
jgi:hypothetical protein